MRFLLAISSLMAVAATRDFIKGISWFGFETEHRGLQLDWCPLPTSFYLNKIQDIGFNSVRLPFSMDFVREGQWDKMDHFFEEIQKTNLTVLLDFHRIEDSHQSSTPWIDGRVSFDDFLGTWSTLLDRYENVSNIIGCDLFNEWQGDGSTSPQWASAARQIMSYLEKRYSQHEWLYFVEGTNWGGNSHDINFEDLPYKDRIMYSVHKYAFTTRSDMEHDWEFSIANHPIERINIGEFGWISDRPDEVAWSKRFMAWLKAKGIRSTYFWNLSPFSGDTGGLFMDCEHVDCRKVRLLREYWS